MRAISKHIFVAVLSCLLANAQASRIDGMSYIKDGEHMETFHSIRKKPLDFIPLSSHMVNFGLSDAVYWLKIDVTLENDEAHALTIDNPLLNKLDLRIYKQGELIDTQSTGRHLAFNKRKHQTKTFIFDLPEQTGKFTCIMRVESLYTISLPINIESKSTIFKRESNMQLFLGFIFGLCLLVCLYNVLLFLLLKNSSSLYYVGYILVFWYYNAMLVGLDITYLYPNSVYWPNISTSVFAGLSYAASALFIKDFFKTKANLPFYDKALKFIIAFGILIAIYPFFFELSITYKKILTYGPLLVTLPYLAVGVRSLRNGYKPAVFFLCAWSVLLAGVIVYGLRGALILDSNFFTTNSVLLGAFGETFMLSFSISYEIRLLQKERNLAQQKQIVYLEELRDIKEESNKELELKVNLRTAELAEKNKQIIDSINYAKRIQQAILPPVDELDENMRDYFILFKPKDIVSGDFYWCHKDESKIYMAVADCTGHGVPGAFMSFLGFSILNEVILEQHYEDPGAILDEVHIRLIKALRKETSNKNLYDGMDICLIVYDKSSQSLLFSGSMRPLVIIEDGEAQLIKGTKCSIGDVMRTGHTHFKTHDVDVSHGDMIYLFTDGYTDQFNSDGKKFTEKQFKRYLEDISHLPGTRQKSLLENNFHSWKGDEMQIDDILVAGVRIIKTV